MLVKLSRAWHVYNSGEVISVEDDTAKFLTQNNLGEVIPDTKATSYPEEPQPVVETKELENPPHDKMMKRKETK